MNHNIYLSFIFLSVLFLSGCSSSKNKNNFSGFWEGPHPENPNKKFYIQFIFNNDSISATGFWTQNNFYNSKFQIDSILQSSDSIRFFIPDWNCFYLGRIAENNLIDGGFSCQGEPFDPVTLIKKNEIKRYITEAKPGSLDDNYKYQYKVPAFSATDIPSSHFHSPNDSLFIYSLIPEIIANMYGRINSFLLVKNGKLICEEYFYGYSAKDLHQIESSTKSITSLLIGIAKDKGMVDDIHEPLYQIFPTYSQLKTGEYPKITIAHLLSMTSGYSNEYEPWKNHNRIDFSLKRKLVEPVGEKFIYDGGNTEILGAVIKSKTGMYADVFANKYLFKPIGIERYDWSVFKQDSFPCLGGSLELLPRDMAKIGWLVLNNGKFGNQQVISKKWIQESTTPKTQTHIPGDDYAFHWWNITLNSGPAKYKTIWANGMGSQFIYIFPELNVVIVTTGHNYENDSWAISDGIRKYIHLLDSKQ